MVFGPTLQESHVSKLSTLGDSCWPKNWPTKNDKTFVPKRPEAIYVFNIPKNPDPSIQLLFWGPKNTPASYRFIHPSIGGSLGILRDDVLDVGDFFHHHIQRIRKRHLKLHQRCQVLGERRKPLVITKGPNPKKSRVCPTWMSRWKLGSMASIC